MATIVGAAGGGNWSATSTWVGSVVPTAADDVTLTVASGSITVDVNSVCRSLDCTGYVSTLTIGASISLSIGDGTAGTGNVALKFVSGMTLTANSTSTFALVSTSGTQQTVTTAGKTLGIIDFNGAGGSWIQGDALTGATLNVTKGTYSTGNFNVTLTNKFASDFTNTRSVTLGSSTIAISGASGWAFSVVTNLTFSGGTATINLTANNAGFGGGGLTYSTVNMTGSGSPTMSGNNTFTTLNRTGTSQKQGQFVLSGNQTVSGTLTLAGASATNRVLVWSATPGTSITLTAGTVSCSNVDFADITGAGAGSWNLASITGNSGDCGGNSGITFTTAATQTWTGTLGGNWSTNAWSGRVPLPQDDVVVNAAFAASQTVTCDMPRMGKSIDFTGVAAVTVSFGSIGNVIYGSLTQSSNLTLSGAQPTTFSGRGSYTLTSAGKATGRDITVSAPSGTLTLQDACDLTGKTLTLLDGTLNTNGATVTCNTVSNSSGRTRTLTLGASTLNLAGTGTVWQPGSTGLTFNANTSTIAITDTSASTKTFSGGNLTYYNLAIATGASAGAVSVQSDNTWNGWQATGGSTITVKFTSTSVQTLNGGAGAFFSGVSGNLVTVQASSSGSAFTVSSATTITTDYINLKDCTASGATPFNAGANSTNSGNNTNWSFSGPSGSLLPFISRKNWLTGGVS
ncbi:MAG: hypothetical protein KGL39_54665 [Patescibacteria group bacterium]|nr:hypothetical protein [Patescibacteria group bacterium]